MVEASTTTVDRFAYAAAPERRERIAQVVIEQGYCTITELSRAFAVSEMTIRRDVARLIGTGQLRGFHGGVGSVNPQDLLGRDYIERDRTLAESKRAIAARAIELIRPNMSIALDAGTTAAQLAAIMPGGLGISVVTHSLSALSLLAPNRGVEVTCLGGVLHPESLSFSGSATLAAIEELQVEMMFLAASGLSERGAFCATSFDAITKRALIEVSARVVLISDSSKYEASAMVKVCGWDAIDVLITDAGLSDARRDSLVQAGVEVVIV